MVKTLLAHGGDPQGLQGLAPVVRLVGQAQAVDEAVEQAQHKLEGMGVLDALRQAGVQPGDTVLFTYRLYNPPAAMLQGEPELQVALLQNEQQIGDFDWQGRARVIENADGSKEIQYMGAVMTKGLAPADYLILCAVPGRDDERQPYIEGAFRIAEK